MKRISYLFFLIFLASIFASSCSSSKTYSQQLDDEKSLIDGFIKRNNIKVVSTFPTDTPWVTKGKDIYVLTPSGLYFHMINPGDSLKSKDVLGVTVQVKNTVVPRFKQYSLGIVSDTISNWSTMNYEYTSDFVYGDPTQSCKAFQEAVSYMLRNNSEAKLIVPSHIGFNSNMVSVTPLGYDLKIKFLK